LVDVAVAEGCRLITRYILFTFLTALAAASLRADDPSPPKAERRSTITIGRETTFVDGPLDSAGYVDYAAALDRRNKLPAGENFIAALWENIGPTFDGRPVRSEYFAALGIEAPPVGGEYFISQREFPYRSAVKIDLDEFDEQGNAAWKPWLPKELPLMAAWVGANERVADRIVAAAARPGLFVPVAVRPQPWRPELMSRTSDEVGRTVYYLSHLLVRRATLRMGQGNYDAAWRDLLALHRIGRLFARSPSSGSQGSGTLAEYYALLADEVFLSHADGKGNRFARCLADLERLPTARPAADAIDGIERYEMLEHLQTMVRVGHPLFETLDKRWVSSTPAGLEAQAHYNLDGALREANRQCDRLVAANRIADRTKRRSELKRIADEVKRIEAEWKQRERVFDGVRSGPAIEPEELGRLAFASAFSQLTWGDEDAGRSSDDQSFDNIKVTFALAAFRTDHARYPDKLNELFPRYLAAIPKDRFSGGPLRYERRGEGYLLYSIGKNEVDDQGRDWADDPQSKLPDRNMRVPVQKFDDLRVRMPQ